MNLNKLFQDKLKVINVGLVSFKESLDREAVDVLQVNWSPPAGGDESVLEALRKLGMGA